MFRNFAMTAWRLAVLFALLWIGWQVQGLRDDLAAPAADPSDLSAGPDTTPPEDDTQVQLALLNQKLDAIMAAMVELKR
jgi:hypothetical protein